MTPPDSPHNEKTVDQVPARLRLGGRPLHEQAVCVGNENLDGPATEGAACDRGHPWKHFLDDVGFVADRLAAHAVTDHDLRPF